MSKLRLKDLQKQGFQLIGDRLVKRETDQASGGESEQALDDQEREIKLETARAKLADIRSRTKDRERRESDRDLAAELAELEASDRDMLERSHGIVTRFFVLGMSAIFIVCLIGIGGFTALILIGIVLALLGIPF